MEQPLDLSVKHCLWCLKPIQGTSSRKYCSDKCRQSAYRFRKKGSPAPVYGVGGTSGMSGEDAAVYIAELKTTLARMAALKGRGDALGDACASAAAVLKDDLEEMGL